MRSPYPGWSRPSARPGALDGLDLNVTQGEVHGFLGPNGSGKSTTIRVLLGLIRASGGTARLLGGDPSTQATELHRLVAYVPGVLDVSPFSHVPKLPGAGASALPLGVLVAVAVVVLAAGAVRIRCRDLPG